MTLQVAKLVYLAAFETSFFLFDHASGRCSLLVAVTDKRISAKMSNNVFPADCFSAIFCCDGWASWPHCLMKPSEV
jgi:hypothetical protein